MKAILELTKERDEGDIFYRYNIDGTLVWFSQYQQNGNIYTVSVRPSKKLEDFEFYVQDDSRKEKYYPEYVEINTSHERLTVEQIDGYVSALKYAKEIAEAIIGIFESGVHKECYDKFNVKIWQSKIKGEICNE
jgi:hypothetical protein